MIGKVNYNGEERTAIIMPDHYDESEMQAVKDAVWQMLEACMSNDGSKHTATGDTCYYMLQLCQVMEDRI